jgi:amino acid adenylation domain-containing protein
VLLSFGQRRLWFLHAMEEAGPVYNIPWVALLDGALNVDALRLALEDVVGRHEVLRTLFREIDGEPVAVVVPAEEAAVRFKVVPTAVADAEMAVAAAASHIFDLASELPVRAWVLELTADKSILVLVVHHIVSDGWSGGLLARDLSTAYAARASGSTPEWDALPVQYKDFVSWQRRRLGERDKPDSLMTRQLAFWRERLAGLPEELSLPYDRPRPAVPSHRGGTVPFSVSAELHTRLDRLASEKRMPVSMLVQTALVALLSRLGAGTDLPIGTIISGRDNEEYDELIGPFMNTIVMRTDTSGNPTFNVLLERMRSVSLDVGSNSEVPFARVVEELSPARSSAGNPLFQILVTAQWAGDFTLRLPGLSTAAGSATTRTAKFDLWLDLVAADNGPGGCAGITGSWEYAMDLFDEETVTSISERLVLMLAALVDDPDRQVGSVNILTDTERANLLGNWYGLESSLPTTSIVGRITEQASRAPDSPAIFFEDAVLTYAELMARTARLSSCLRDLQVGPGDLVAVALERSPDMIIAALAILALGAAYVPVDPGHPDERIANMMVEAAPKCMVTSARFGQRAWGKVPRFIIDQPDIEARLNDPGPASFAEADESASNEFELAYVIYTSGSTGKPNGVGVTRAGLENAIVGVGDMFRLSPDSRLLSVASFSFDMSVADYWAPLTRGASIVLANKDEVHDYDALANLRERHKVTHLQATPSFTNAMRQEHRESLCGLRLFCGGEALSSSLAVELGELSLELMNMYGPTETTIYATSNKVVERTRTDPSIGRPVPNTRAYVLDSNLNMVPPGVSGQLYLAGPHLARGYLGRPGLTAERFVADPFVGPGQRMYRSGDLARWTTSGELEYLGRIDDQVKMRGFRIELGEIEAALATHVGVASCAVLVRADRFGDAYLVAYYVLATGSELADGELRAHVASRLPDYMIPSVFEELQALPLTVNGKLDRAALPAPRLAPAVAGRKASTPVEAQLCAIFAELLALDEISIDASFFDLGGHSLMATRLVSRIRKEFGVGLALRDVFAASTVTQLAQRIDRSERSNDPLTHLVPQRRPERVPLSFAQQRIWILDQIEGGSAAYNVAYSFHIPTAVDERLLEVGLLDVLGRHESLRTIYQDCEGEPHQVVLDLEDVDFRIQHIQQRGGVQESIAQAASVPFSLGTDLPLRATLFVDGDGERILLLVFHHIAIDGWSFSNFCRDLDEAYYSRVNGGSPAWSPLPLQYADYALWQRDALGSAFDADNRFARQLEFWRAELEGLPVQLALPYDRPRPAASSHRGEFVQISIPPELHGRIARLANSRKSTVFTTLLASLAVVLHHIGAGNDIPIGYGVAGRRDDALSELIGFFVNTMVVRVDLADDPSFAELVERLHVALMAAWDNQDVPFDSIVETVNPPRSPSRHPLFQTMLMFEDVNRGTSASSRLLGAENEVSTGTAKFDMLFNLTEHYTQQQACGGITGFAEFSSDLFDRATSESIVSWLIRVVDSVTRDPSVTLSQVELMDVRERRKILTDWNGTAVELPSQTLVERIQLIAADSPNSVAVIDARETVTYGQLNSQANRLSRLLVERGVGPGHNVAVLLPRSVAVLVSFLAIMKIGATYVPLDVNFPADRITYLLDDACPTVIVANGQTAKSVGDRRVILIGGAADRAALDQHLNTDLGGDELGYLLSPLSAAYLIYTSGSTGQPKGVMVQFAVLDNLLAWNREAINAPDGGRVAQFSSLTFDASIHEFLSVLLNGKTLVIPSEEIRLYSDEFVAWIERENITELFAPDLVVGALYKAANEQGLQLETLRHVLQAGEPLRLTSHVKEFHRRRPWVRLHNHYGPSETHVVTAYTMPEDPELWPAVAPIGRPVWNTRAYVLDSNLRPVPAGVAGELYLSGEGVALGYLRRPQLTATRFVADPFGPPGTRMYRSGDVARLRRDGELEFLGRVDDQVKIRGIRIEPEEVAAVIGGHPAVARAMVVAREYSDGGKFLAAYLTLVDPAVQPDPGTLRDYAAGKLPDYMIPANFVVLEQLPLTRNGKLDRQAIAAIELPAQQVGSIKPCDDVERQLCEVFEEILKVEEIGTEGNFFLLGGNSLLAAKLVNRVRTAFRVEMTVRAVFEAPTVGALAGRIGKARRAT